MPDFLEFDAPWWMLLACWILLAVLLPIIWVFGYWSLAGLGRARAVTALCLRSLVIVLLVLALAEMLRPQKNDRLAVIFLLDQSESVPEEKKQVMLDYVPEAVARHRRDERGDMAGVIVFGKDARVEIPPYDDDIYVVGGLEATRGLETDHTNLAEALKLAQASFPEDTARRIVIVSDGNENLGDARTVAKALAHEGVAIDVLPVRLESRAEVVVEKIALPPDMRLGQTVEARVVVNNYAQPSEANPEGIVRGTLELKRLYGEGDEETVATWDGVDLVPGKNVFTVRHEIEQAAVYTYKAEFTPDNPADDQVTKNNAVTAFTHVRGKGRILLIEDWENKGEFDDLVASLRRQKVEVDVRASDNPFSSPEELLAYDTVVLANVPRASGDSDDEGNITNVTNFSDDQIKDLVANTETMGCGLVMIGGDRSFGAGGWANTELEKAMPVDFQIKNAKVQAVGALALMMHASEMAQGNHWQKVVAQKAIEALGSMDWCGLVYWDFGGDAWMWGTRQGGMIRTGQNRKLMLSRTSRMTPGDMPDFNPAMQMALRGFNYVGSDGQGPKNAAIKHMIIISDGDPSPPTPQTIAAYKSSGIKVTTVAVGAHGTVGTQVLKDIATDTGGKYYIVKDPQALPKIYQREARRVSRPLIYEPDGGVGVDIVYPHEMLGGIERGSPPRLKGYVMTTKKENPLVEQAIIADKPADGGRNSTILASWHYGLGRTVVFTSDAGARWANDWESWEHYDKFWKQVIDWSMRPVNDEGKFTVATDFKDGKVRVVVTALDKEDEFLNFLNMNGEAIGPDRKPYDVEIKQVAPGRYVGEFAADGSGSYFIAISPGSGNAPLLAGVTVPYSAEYKDQETNYPLLDNLAANTTNEGEVGVVIGKDLSRTNIEELLAVDVFRPMPERTSWLPVWFWLLAAAGVTFFFDVLVRRVQMGLAWLRSLLAWIGERFFGRQREVVEDEHIARLKSRKAAVGHEIDQRRAAQRFEPVADAEAAEDRGLDAVIADVSGERRDQPPPPPPSPTGASPQEEQETYMDRLLKAKQQAKKKEDGK